MRTAVFVLALAPWLASCGGGREITLTFEGLVGGQPAACGGVYAGIGTTGTELTLLDYRLYVHDVRLVTDDGREVPLELEQNEWQHENVALLDFEGGDGCDSGTVSTNSVVRGVVAEDATFTGVRFRLGVPFALNHADVSTAPPPLNYTSMFWSWNAGYKFVRVEGRTTGLTDGWRLHLGSIGCEGDGRGNVTSCAAANVADVELTGFDPDVDTIAADLADLLADSNLDTDEGGQLGCMS
ncbi:MAG TPA: MbnP family copper-binding protein, partial [Sandaracinaceae bacterium]